MLKRCANFYSAFVGLFGVLAVTLFALPLAGHAADMAHPRTPLAMAEDLQSALRQADQTRVQSLLAPDVRVYESGHVEASLAEYAAHHLPADITFMSQMQARLLERQVNENGDTAVVMSRSRLQGDYAGKARDLFSNETLVMQRRGAKWMITHIHWSSADAKKAH